MADRRASGVSGHGALKGSRRMDTVIAGMPGGAIPVCRDRGRRVWG